jgi:outer membrane protein assembly factor BamB
MRAVTALFVLVLTVQCADAADVLSSRNDFGRTGVNAAERILTPAAVGSGRFGKTWTLYADAQIVAQPLYVSGLEVDTTTNPKVPRVQGKLNALLIATMHNTVYLYDTDRERPGPEGRNVPLWATWLGQPRPGGGDIDGFFTNDPEWGILGTPAIDPTKSIVYVVAWHDDGGGPDSYRYRLHALRLKDGAHMAPPLVIDAPGLNPKKQKQRAGLVLANGVLYITFGGDGSQGLLLAYDAVTLTRKAFWSPTPTGKNGGIWHSGQPPAVDRDGNLYLMIGNGTFGNVQGSENYGQSFLKLRLEGDKIVVKDHFTPCNAQRQSDIDNDLGSSGPVLIPGGNIVIGGGKDHHIYVLSTDNMGKHVPPPQPGAEHCPNPNALQQIYDKSLGHIHSSPVYWEGTDGARVYVWGENTRLRAYRFAKRRIVLEDVKLSQYNPPQGMPGGMLSLSSNGRTDGILWAVVPLDGDANKYRGVKAILLALDPRDVSKAFWTSEQAGGGLSRVGLFAKFVPPTIADGKVFVATYGDDEPLRQYGGNFRPQVFPGRYQVAVYGMLPEAPTPVVDQNRDDVQLVRAEVDGGVTVDMSRCRPGTADTRDCTQELQRTAGAPSLQQVIVPAASNFAGCQVLRVTTAVKNAALDGALGIGFYSADTNEGQFSADHGRRVPAKELKPVGKGTLKNGEPAVLHEFVGISNCEVAGGARTGKQMKPYMDFLGGPPRTIYRNWDPIAGNYAVTSQSAPIDRRGEVLR